MLGMDGNEVSAKDCEMGCVGLGEADLQEFDQLGIGDGPLGRVLIAVVRVRQWGRGVRRYTQRLQHLSASINRLSAHQKL